MEKEDLELRFVCKLCDKKYPCGKSLGGHMRSHVIAAAAAANSAESEENFEQSMTMKKVSSFHEVGGPSGYGLRENPKKTWRAVDSTFPLPQERVCKQCGKGFQSLKALCGHMACHSEKERLLKDDHSWTSDNPNLLVDSHSDTEAEDLKRQTRSKSKRYKRIVVKSSQFSLPNNNNNGGGGSSSVSEFDELELEEVAMCLVMLSRDSWNWGGVNSFAESSDNNSVVLETKSSSIDMKIGRRGGFNFVDEAMEIKKLVGDRKLKASALDAESVQFENSYSGYLRNGMKKVESDVSVDEVLRNGEYKKQPKTHGGGRVEVSDAELAQGFNRGNSYEIELSKGLTNGKGFGEFGRSSKSKNKKRIRDGSNSPEYHKESVKKVLYDSLDGEQSKNAHKRSKYECLNCNKTFNSHQALGGHRPCHKKINATFASRYESLENSIEDDDITPDSTPIGKLGERFSNKKPVTRDTPGNAGKRNKSKKSKGHECPICFRMFKSGQALGGHKRSHFLNGSEDFSNPTVVIKQEAADIHDLIDLNLPAPEENDEANEDDQFIY